MGGSAKTKAAVKAATTTRLTTVAARLFRARGYEAVSLRDVASGAGKTTGAVFAHFAGKAALYEAAMGKPPPDVVRFVRELVEDDGVLVGGTAARARELLAQLVGVEG